LTKCLQKHATEEEKRELMFNSYALKGFASVSGLTSEDGTKLLTKPSNKQFIDPSFTLAALTGWLTSRAFNTK
jgi:hypothetical protein